MFQLSFMLMVSILGSLFLCSFSSILSASIMIILSLITVTIMYWNMILTVPLYLFLLFMIGGLFVLIGFVMMADTRDVDMILSEESILEYFFSSLIIWLSLGIFSGKSELSVNWFFYSFESNFSYNFSFFPCIYIFLLILLLVFLLLVYMMMKSSLGSGGFLKF